MRHKIVVFSWTGNTAACAIALQRELECEVFQLVEKKERSGKRGFALGGMQASFGLQTDVLEMPDLSDTDVLILGMPVWAGTTPPAINAFFRECSVKGKKVYAFSTQMSPAMPARLEKKLTRIVERQGGTFGCLFAQHMPRSKRLSVEDAAKRAPEWAARIRSGE